MSYLNSDNENNEDTPFVSNFCSTFSFRFLAHDVMLFPSSVLDIYVFIFINQWGMRWSLLQFCVQFIALVNLWLVPEVGINQYLVRGAVRHSLSPARCTMCHTSWIYTSVSIYAYLFFLRKFFFIHRRQKLASHQFCGWNRDLISFQFYLIVKSCLCSHSRVRFLHEL